MPKPSGAVLEMRAAGLKADDVDILADLSFALNGGEWTFLLGPPAAGKTTLLRLAAGEIAPTAGAVERLGAGAFVFHAMPLDDQKSSRAIVAGAAGADDDTRANDLLAALGLDAYLNHEPFRLSRGHRMRLAIAQALAARPALLCLDDPFAPLDRNAQARAATVLRRAADQGLAIFMISNDPLDALRYADRIALLSAGPGARVVRLFGHTPTPDLSDARLAETQLFRELEAAMESKAAE